VNANSLTFILPKQALDDLLQELQEFMAWLDRKIGVSWTLQWWQRLAGWMNWSFNVFPMICPALNNVYPKIFGKDQSLMKIWVNNDVWSDLKWAIGHLHNSLGVHLLSSVTWNAEDADETIFCDVCMDGLTFWYTNHWQGFFSPVSSHLMGKMIFFYEALATTSATNNLQGMGMYHLKIMVYTDSMKTVNIFSSLHCQSIFNTLVQFCIDSCINYKLDLQVLHVPGVKNEVADAISCHHFEKALRLVPGLQISHFQPPHCATLGAAKKMIMLHVHT